MNNLPADLIATGILLFLFFTGLGIFLRLASHKSLDKPAIPHFIDDEELNKPTGFKQEIDQKMYKKKPAPKKKGK